MYVAENIYILTEKVSSCFYVWEPHAHSPPTTKYVAPSGETIAFYTISRYPNKSYGMEAKKKTSFCMVFVQYKDKILVYV